MVQPIPEGLSGTVIPYLLIDGASDAIAFYERAFGAVEKQRLSMPDGTIAHGWIEIDGASINVADAPPDMDGTAGNPRKLGGTSVMIHRYVEDVDAAFTRAIDAGATSVREPEDQFYGDRTSLVEDPYGHRWSLHQRIEMVSPEEMSERMANMM